MRCGFNNCISDATGHELPVAIWVGNRGYLHHVVQLCDEHFDIVKGDIYHTSIEEKKTPTEWEKTEEYVVWDPDGWRVDNTPWDKPITYEDYKRRKVISTIGFRRGY